MKLFFYISVFLLSICPTFSDEINIREIPQLPETGYGQQLGYAGPYAGHHNGALIIAGGANFPEGLPWEKVNGKNPDKVYHDSIIYYLKDKEGNWQPKVSDLKLPDISGYGASVSHPEFGVICIGGEWRKRNEVELLRGLHEKAFSLKYVDGRIKIDEGYPALPFKTTSPAFGLIDDKIYVVCGQTESGPTNKMWTLDLKKKGTVEFKWQSGPELPSSARVLPASTVQFDGKEKALFVFGGRIKTETGFDFRTDNWKFLPIQNEWQQISDCEIDKQKVSHCAAVAFPSGGNYTIILGGDHPQEFNRREFDIPNEITKEPSKESILKEEQKRLFAEHSGFKKAIYSYNAITDAWAKIGQFPEQTPVTTTAITTGEGTFIPSGEVRPGVRSPKVWSFTFNHQSKFGWIAYTVLTLYLIGILINGAIFSKKMKSTEDFFKAGGRIPWWAAGLSIFGTQLSAITFMAVPAMAYSSNWQKMINNFTIIMVAPLVIFIFLPFYRKLNITTAYEYLEKRFNLAARLIGAIFFNIMQFGRIGIVLLLPSIALSVATGIDQNLCIIAMGILCIAYTCLGGMEAVIWTDVTQVIILTLGAIVALIMLLTGSDSGALSAAIAEGKTSTFNMNFDLSTENFWVILIGGLALNLVSYGSDQSVIQRYMTTPSESEARKSIWTNAILSIPATFLFFAIGTALFTYFQSNPELLSPTMQTNDAIFPMYIVNQMPTPLAGLLIAAIFAAAMSSLDSSMNSVSACITTDFYRRLSSKVDEKKCLKLARIITLTVGLAGTAFALWMAHSDIKSLWDQLVKYIGLFGGGLGGLFLLGMLNKKANGPGAIAGLMLSVAAQYFTMTSLNIHSWLYAFIGLVSCFIGGSIFSLFFKPSKTNSELILSLQGEEK